MHLDHVGDCNLLMLERGIQEGVDGFLEESIVRRELSDNYVFYVKNYDKFEAAADWAKTSLDLHRKDKREYLYSL